MEETDDDDPGSSRGALIALAVVVVLVLGGLWLAHVLGKNADQEDCRMSGRTNCDTLHPAN